MGVDSLEQVLLAGGNVKTNTFTVDSLVRLANAARHAGTMLTIVGAMNVETMVKVVQAGGKNVTWDVAKYETKD